MQRRRWIESHLVIERILDGPAAKLKHFILTTDRGSRGDASDAGEIYPLR